MHRVLQCSHAKLPFLSGLLPHAMISPWGVLCVT